MWNDKFRNKWCSDTYPENSESVMMKYLFYGYLFLQNMNCQHCFFSENCGPHCNFKQDKSGKSFSGCVFLLKYQT